MPKPKQLDARFEARIPADLLKQARQAARRERKTLSAKLRELLEAWLAEMAR